MVKKILLSESDIPERWYNILPDLPAPPAPYLHPATLQPMGPADLAPIFPQAIIAQEVSAEPWIEIPDQVRDVYRMWRPSPVYRADRLEKALDTPAHIYFKYEGVSPAGSHKPNTAVPQAYYNSKEGVKRLTTETGAGQWGSALAFAGCLFGLEVTVYMVKVSYEQKPYRRAMMETWGAKVHASPTNLTNAGRGILAGDPDSPGSLGIAISEAVEDAATHDDAKYSLGSVVNHVLLHQTIIGLEAKKQMEMAGAYPDVVIGCVGGGSNFAGLSYPFIGRPLQGQHPKTRFIAPQPRAPPDPLHLRRAGGMPNAHPGRVRVRLRRRSRPRSRGEDVHARPQLCARPDPRRRSPLPRRRPIPLPAGRQRRRRGPSLQAERMLRRGCAVRAHGRFSSCAGGCARPARGCRRGRRSKRSWRKETHPLRPLRARALRHVGVRRLLRGQAGGR